jgi:hypothetical protein
MKNVFKKYALPVLLAVTTTLSAQASTQASLGEGPGGRRGGNSLGAVLAKVIKFKSQSAKQTHWKMTARKKNSGGSIFTRSRKGPVCPGNGGDPK